MDIETMKQLIKTKPRVPAVANGQPLAKAACIYLIKAACYKCG